MKEHDFFKADFSFGCYSLRKTSIVLAMAANPLTEAVKRLPKASKRLLLTDSLRELADALQFTV